MKSGIIIKNEDALNNKIPSHKQTTSIPCTSTIWCKTETHNRIDKINYLPLLCCNEDDDDGGDDDCGSVTIAARRRCCNLLYNNKSLKAVYCLQANQIRNSSKMKRKRHTHSHSFWHGCSFEYTYRMPHTVHTDKLTRIQYIIYKREVKLFYITLSGIVFQQNWMHLNNFYYWLHMHLIIMSYKSTLLETNRIYPYCIHIQS